MTSVLAALAAFEPRHDEEAADVARLRELATQRDPWPRSLFPLHATGSAIIVDPAGRRVLLRWHQRQQAWLQVGGHGDPGESDPLTVALREGAEETGLADLQPWPDAGQPVAIQVTVVPVAAGKGEPAHEHADIRYALATTTPDGITPESDTAQLEWLSVEDALARATDENLRIGLRRVAELLERSRSSYTPRA
ncbi:MAG TPA: NUDIX domain-containing protein [Chloroflexota bacterium]|nr:NUDIX domain-containing protein [Chloroflexota bacterium]